MPHDPGFAPRGGSQNRGRPTYPRTSVVRSMAEDGLTASVRILRGSGLRARAGEWARRARAFDFCCKRRAGETACAPIAGPDAVPPHQSMSRLEKRSAGLRSPHDSR